VLAMLLVPARHVVSNVNIALLLVIAVVGAATVGGRLAGVVAAVMVTASFDFFHTEPVRSLHIASREGFATVLILLGVGVIVGTVAGRAHRARGAVGEQRDELRTIHRMAELAASGMPAGLVVEAACAELTSLMGLRSCSFRGAPPDDEHVMLDRRGAIGGRPKAYIATKHGLELPRSGVAIGVLARGRLVGVLELEPTPGVGVPLHTRMAAVVIADQVGGALDLPVP
jgi:hypothetical protein